MSESNRTTLNSYEQHVPEYISGTASSLTGAEKNWIDAVLDRLPADSRILEIGSGPGRDALYIGSCGFNVHCTDATPAFVQQLKSRGLNAGLLNILTDPIETEFDVIIANSVLLHFNRDEFGLVLRKVGSALRVGGRFGFSLKQGDGEEWSSHKLNAPRYFCYWNPHEVKRYLLESGFCDLSITSVSTERTYAEWMYVIASRSP